MWFRLIERFVLAMSFAMPAFADDSRLELHTDLIPAPAHLERFPGVFPLTSDTALIVPPKSESVRNIAEYLAGELKQVTGWMPAIVSETGPSPAAGRIRLTTAGANADLGPEGYTLSIDRQGVLLQAVQPAGFFHGVQTLRQLLQPISFDRPSPSDAGGFAWPSVRIVDQPRYRWRGMLLDCCRHFMDKAFVKRYLDLLAYHKMNVLHWHLTEDQGWRIEIKKYPKLTGVGAWREEGGVRYGGFYTQDDVREIVAYAASRYITVVPEIEMPGHSRAALVAYPEFSCRGEPLDVANKSGIFEDVYCAGNDATFAFLEDVLSEVIELFPSEFIHIGGDECPKTRWKECPKCQARIKAEGLKDEHELQSYFIRRIERFLNRKGRRLVGWDEILEGGLAPNATVQSWRGMQGAVAAAKAGHDVIASPTSHCYLDYPQEPNPAMPRWMRVTSLQKAYTFEPTPPELNKEEAKHVLGGECNLWTERVPQTRVDHQTFPRLCAIAEATWSPAERRDWEDFSARMNTHYDRLDVLGVNYYIPMPRCGSEVRAFTDAVEVTLVNPFRRGEVFYTLDGSEPTRRSSRYVLPIRLTNPATLRARTILATGNQSDVAEYRFVEQAPQPAVQTPELAPGLTYHYYEGEWTHLPDFATLTSVAGGIVMQPNLDMRRREEHFAVDFRGFLNVPTDGVYAFFLNADDGVRLRLDSQTVVENDGLHGPTELRGQIILRAGWHALEIEYFQHRRAHRFVLQYEGPGFARQPIPEASFAHAIHP